MDTVKSVFHNSFFNRTEFEMTKGSRPWHMFLILSEGSFRYKIGKNEFLVEKDEIAFFPQNTYFEREIITPIGFHQFGFFINSETDSITTPPVGILNIPKENVRALIRMLEAAAFCSAEAKQEIYLHTLRHILIENTLFSMKKNPSAEKADKDVDFVIRYMTDHINEKIEIQELADSLHLSRIALFGKFKKQTGYAPSDFLIHLRMRYAKHLLLDSTLRVGEIAALCGYANTYYFSNSFKNRYGTSPKEFRRIHLSCEKNQDMGELP